MCRTTKDKRTNTAANAWPWISPDSGWLLAPILSALDGSVFRCSVSHELPASQVRQPLPYWETQEGHQRRLPLQSPRRQRVSLLAQTDPPRLLMDLVPGQRQQVAGLSLPTWPVYYFPPPPRVMSNMFSTTRTSSASPVLALVPGGYSSRPELRLTTPPSPVRRALTASSGTSLGLCAWRLTLPITGLPP